MSDTRTMGGPTWLTVCRSGRPRQLDHADILAATLSPPKKYEMTLWSSRLLGQHLKISNITVARAWRADGVKPWKAGSFRLSTAGVVFR